MFLLTIDSKDPVKIAAALRNLANGIIESNAIGLVHCSPNEVVEYEYDIFQQPWVCMADFLHFDADGNTLIKQESQNA